MQGACHPNREAANGWSSAIMRSALAMELAAQGTPQPSAASHTVVPRQALRSADADLPRYLTRWFGFEAEAAALVALLARERLVVLRGPGGAGKTRLAVEIARACVERASEHAAAAGLATPNFDRVVFVPLASCTQRQEMLYTLLHTLHQDSAARPDDAAASVASALAGQHILLVLDNFEQLVEAGRDDLARWLSTLPQLHLMVTSRRALGLDGESEHVLSALPLPLPGVALSKPPRMRRWPCSWTAPALCAATSGFRPTTTP
jgi:hypothetical protein